MLETVISENCLVELLPYGSFPVRGFRKVSDIDQPVREITAIEDIRPNGLPLSAPVGGIYSAQYIDGTRREVFVWLDDKDNDDFDSAVFLKPGRTSNQFSEVRELMMNDPKDRVPQSLKESLRRFQEGRDQEIAAKLQLG